MAYSIVLFLWFCYMCVGRCDVTSLYCMYQQSSKEPQGVLCTKDGFRCVYLKLTNGLKYNPKKPQKCITTRPIYYPRHHPGQYWSDRGFRGWCSARIHNMVPSNADLFMATNQEEGGRQEDLQPC